MRIRAGSLPWAAAAVLALGPWGAAHAQARPELRVRAGGAEAILPLATGRGYAALPVSRLTLLGWEAEGTPLGAVLTGPRGETVEVWDGTPFLRWDGALVHLADLPYFEGGELYVPLQLVSDLLPARSATAYRFDGAGLRLTYQGTGAAVVAEPTVAPDPAPPPNRPDTAGAGSARGEPVRAAVADSVIPPVADTPAAARPSPDTAADRAAAVPTYPPTGRRVVIIDAGHGGEDPGTISRSGVREKNVALSIARAMAEVLRTQGDVDVLLIRDGDTFVPPWDRGARATDMKGERYGIFVSIHANSAASPTSTARGFETYFLSEARTEHERRVAAIENAPLGVAPPEESAGDLDFILRELKNLDQQHWSSLLAEMVQGELARIHPGPNRGVKQGPLAVLTNAIMPAVLVEIGYLSHPEEARLLDQASFQKEAGEALAIAVGRFFQRYPPGAS